MGATLETTDATLAVMAVTVPVLIVCFHIRIRTMHRQLETQSIVPPVMRMISNVKVITLVEKTVLLNRTRTALVVDVTGSIAVNFDAY